MHVLLKRMGRIVTSVNVLHSAEKLMVLSRDTFENWHNPLCQPHPFIFKISFSKS